MISTRSIFTSHLARRVQDSFKASFTRSFTSPAYKRYLKVKKVHSKPTQDVAKQMPTEFFEMENSTLITCAAMEIHDARVEVLKRHIMVVDGVHYDEATKTFKLIADANREGMLLAALPYKIGIVTATGAAFLSLPMVFDLNLALWFNQDYVTTDVPEPRDLETALEVGSWTWNWMEPPLGTMSFALLCLQYSRAQLGNLGIKPYTGKLKEMRARKLAQKFPKYDPDIIYLFSSTDPMVVRS